MAYNEKEMLRDFNGVVIPTQYYVETADASVLDSSTSATAAVIGTLATEATLTSTASALGTTADADTTLTVIGRLKKILATLEAGITVTESTPLTTIGTTVADGDNTALGSTTDTSTATTVIGRLQKLIADLGTLADSKTLSDIITAIDYESGISATGAIGTITATTTASAAIAGGTALADRKGMEILNNSANVVYWGYTDAVTTATGMPINPGISKNFEFKPSVATAIYVIAASDSELYIHEWK